MAETSGTESNDPPLLRLFRLHERVHEFIALPVEEAIAIGRGRGLQVRVLRTGMPTLPVRMDHRPNRINLLERDGYVIEAAYF